MRINKMDDILMQIYDIKNIEEVWIYDLSSSISVDNRLPIIPSLYVSYDGGKVINLCNKDKYFDVLFKKVREVYSVEKDRIIVDKEKSPFRDIKIKIDDNTKRILEENRLLEIENVYNFYNNKKSYSDSLLVQKDEFKFYLPIILYHLKDIYSYMNITINYDDYTINGYRDNYSINVKIDGMDEQLYIKYKKINEYNFEFDIRSSYDKFNSITMNIDFRKDRINVMYDFKNKNVNGEYDYFINNNEANYSHKLYRNKLLVNKNGKLNEVNNEYKKYTSLDSEDNMKWYLLPWNGLYGVNNSIIKVNDVNYFMNIHNKYFSIIDGDFLLKEYLSKSYNRKLSFSNGDYKISLEEVDKIITGIKLFDDIYVIETFFDDNGVLNYYYDSYLENKYFYHLYNAKKDLKKDNLIEVNKEKNVIYGSDLYDKNNILKLVRGIK